MDPRLADLLARQEIEDVVLRYCRGIDRRDFELVRSCYHPDALDHHGSFSGGIDDYVLWVERLTSRYRWTMHLVGNVLVEFAPERDGRGEALRAAGETYGVSLHRAAEGEDTEARPWLDLVTGFRYLDRFERRDGAWRIAERTALGEWSRRLPAQHWWPIPEEHEHGRRDAGDALYRLLASLGLPGRADDAGS